MVVGRDLGDRSRHRLSCRSFGLRVALGVGEAGAYPSNAGIASKWFPDKERATVSGLFDSASKFGGAVAMPLIVWMIALMGPGA